MAVIMVGWMSACKEDPVIEVIEGINVGDGYYLAEVGVDPVATAQLKPEQVDGPGISAMDRTGFMQGYMYLTAGDYNLVEVADKAIVQTLGGTHSTVAGADAHNTECGGEASTSYDLVSSVAESGAAFTVAADGWYVVAYDTDLAEIVYDQLTSVGIIGDATPGGWGEDTPMTTTITADGVSATVEGVTLDVAQFKFRFNCRWAIDRRLDTNQDFDNANGYSFWTNYGGTIDNLVPGNITGNIQVAEYAVYTVTFAWTPLDGATATITRTGDAVPKPQFPDAMYITGAGTTYGWATPGDSANAVMHTIAGGTDGVFWKICHLEAGQGFKLSAASWGIPNIDFPMIDLVDPNGVAITGAGNDWTVATSDMYTVVLDLRNDSIKVSIKQAEVYGMGGAFPTTPAWTAGAPENLFTIDAVAMTMTSPALRADDNIRTYVSHAWIPDWWNAEFVPNAGTIEYRNNSSNDPSAIAGTTGQVITYYFDTNKSTVQ